MEEYKIGRWDQVDSTEAGQVGTVSDLYVPPEVETIARQVMERYDMRVHDMRLITAKPDKGGAIWKIETDKGPRSLKVLHRDPKRSLFSIGAQQYLVERGARVPALVSSKDQTLYVEAGGKAWIVTDWIEPLQQTSKIDLEGASALCYGLGEFHRHSKGYVPPAGALTSSRLARWQEYFNKIVNKIGWFRHIAEVYNEHESTRQLLSVIEQFEKQARESLDRLRQSSYPRMAAMGNSYWGLAHQDFGWSNGQMGPGGLWVIDLDGVSYDLPIRDLRKLITSTMDDMGNWDITWIRGMIDAYHAANPIDRETFEVLLIDMAFPNEFYKHVKEIVYDPTVFISQELGPILQRIMATEESKWIALNELAADKDKYVPGDYSALPEHEMFDQWRQMILEGNMPQYSESEAVPAPTGTGESDGSIHPRTGESDDSIHPLPAAKRKKQPNVLILKPKERLTNTKLKKKGPRNKPANKKKTKVSKKAIPLKKRKYSVLAGPSGKKKAKNKSGKVKIIYKTDKVKIIYKIGFNKKKRIVNK